MESAARPASPFVVLWRAFFAQFFASESATSDVQLRQAIIWALAFLITPGMLLVVQVVGQSHYLFIRARVLHKPWLVDDLLAGLAAVLVTYSMVTIGFIAVFVWDALAFDRRDAMAL